MTGTVTIPVWLFEALFFLSCAFVSAVVSFCMIQWLRRDPRR